MMFITTLGIEIYGVMNDKRTTKNLKHLNQAINWSRFCPQTGVLVVQSGTSASSLQPFLIKTGGSVTKLPKVDHSHAAAAGNTGTDIREKDVAVLKLYANLFVPLVEASGPGQSSPKIQRLVSVILEYSRSLEEQRIPVQHFLNEVLIHLLVRNESWYQLHQLLQYRVISDSKPLACLLLSLESVYPAAAQLATDMLTRLRNSGEEICEILLSKGKVLSAIHFADERGLIQSDTLKVRKFLEAASSLTDESERRAIFYSTFTYLGQKNLLFRGCDAYVDMFDAMFTKA